ncbi:hypothetical protein Y032_0180g769 [Ancylostoma ceylanicum]|uniref:Uncharacterized protein n=1 Tax=Ancylostoma ceylanicum TaxID=53326 RepID=A0A016SST5_9BILA|nr:hypothetical protein Y032_0180g769 [Ancylostoma ceylanicum]
MISQSPSLTNRRTSRQTYNQTNIHTYRQTKLVIRIHDHDHDEDRGNNTVYPKRRVRPSGRGSHACEQSTSLYLLCVSRFIAVFLISTNDSAVTWTAWADSSFSIHCTYRLPRHIAVDRCQTELMASTFKDVPGMN